MPLTIVFQRIRVEFPKSNSKIYFRIYSSISVSNDLLHKWLHESRKKHGQRIMVKTKASLYELCP